MTDSSESEESSKAIFKEVAVVYGTVIAVIILFSILAQFVGFLGEFLYAIVALLFYFVPHKLIERRGWKYETFAITMDRRRRGILWGLGATLVTIPFFIAGFWVWEVVILDHTFEPELARYKQFSAGLSGSPDNWGQDEAGVWVWGDGDRLNVGVANTGRPNNRIVVTSSQPMKAERRGALSVSRKSPTKLVLSLTHSKSRGSVSIVGADDVSVEVEPVVAGNDVWPLYEGPSAKKVKQIDASRGYLWMLLWIATQFLLVAFPEEYFYRGYIQTRLQQGFDARRSEGSTRRRDLLGFTPAIFFASLLFGLGHLLVPIGGVILATRMTVFFPSLLFGWLRDKTDTILASTIYHTCCNLMVLIGAVHFI